MAGSFTFVPPPEAPVFRPTEEEFKDPLEFLLKIRHIGLKTGICKIIPPKSWNPPFVVNTKEFSFTPRIQRLYELEAHSRIKLNFLSRLYKFNTTQGGDKVRVPSVGGRFVDLYALHKSMKELGGYEHVCTQHLWPTLTTKLGYQARYASNIRLNYEKLLLSFDRIVASITLPAKGTQLSSRRSKRKRLSTDSELEAVNYATNKELRNLQFFGPGPKAAVPPTDNADKDKILGVENINCLSCGSGDDEANLLLCSNEKCTNGYHTYCLVPPLQSLPKYDWQCPSCVRDVCVKPPEPYGFPQSSKVYSLQEFGVMADDFKTKYFNKPCTDVPCSVVEQEFWRILQEYNDDVVVEYGADIHSSDHGSGFPTESRLKKFVGTADQLEDAKRYALSPWNLNVLPLLDRSVLRFIKGNIDGMKIPWCYVGMLFSSFCWHIEDHWSYSINFNHLGEPKTWYGVPTRDAEAFEQVMRKLAPELFYQSPDLLHHITTNINPNLLQAEGVPIYRTDQYCGEFVVTFPRAYHSGFNQGFNFAEAVNICPSDWLPIGRACIEHYAEMKRPCVFSNDELLCTLAEVAVGKCKPEDVLMVTNPGLANQSNNSSSRKRTRDISKHFPPSCSMSGLDIDTTVRVHDEFKLLYASEQELRRGLIARGISQSMKIRFDQLNDDARVCDTCLTTLFLSGITCPCFGQVDKREFLHDDTVKMGGSPYGSESIKVSSNDGDPPRASSHMVCLRHWDKLCDKCPISSWTLKCHYSIEELGSLEEELSRHLSSFYEWRDRLHDLLSGVTVANTDGQPTAEAIAQSRSARVKRSYALAELEEMLTNGLKLGYQTDQVYAEAEQLFDSTAHLIHLCQRVKTQLTVGESVGQADGDDDNDHEGEGNKDDKMTVHFQTLRPARFTTILGGLADTNGDDNLDVASSTNSGYVMLQHKIDLKNLRELDVERLADACRELYPLDISTHPDVAVVTSFKAKLTAWRESACKTVVTVNRLASSSGASGMSTRSSLVTPRLTPAMLSGGGDCPSAVDGDDFSDGKMVSLLDAVLNQLSAEFPGFFHNVSEWERLDVLRQAFQWLVGCQKTIDACISWSLPGLRQYLAMGERLLASLATAVTATSPLSLVDVPATASIVRLQRARMHTGVGQLSQVLVQVDSLVDLLTEVFNSQTAYPFLRDQLCPPEVFGVLEQLNTVSVCRLVEADPQKYGSVDDLRPSEAVVKLQDAVSRKLNQMYESLKENRDLDIIAREIRLREVKTMKQLSQMLLGTSGLSVGDGFCQPPPPGHHAELARSLAWLDQVLTATQLSVGKLTQEFSLPAAVGDTGGGGASQSGQADSHHLLSALLPKFTSASESDIAVQEFLAAYNISSESAVEIYKDIAKRSFDVISEMVDKAISAGTLCRMCSNLLHLDYSPSFNNHPHGRGCSLCFLHSKTTCPPSAIRLSDILHLWRTNDYAPSDRSPEEVQDSIHLCAPEVLAIYGLLDELDSITCRVIDLVQENKLVLQSVTRQRAADLTSSPLFDCLPQTLGSVVADLLDFGPVVEADSSADDRLQALIGQLRPLVAFLNTLAVDTAPQTMFLSFLLTSLLCGLRSQ